MSKAQQIKYYNAIDTDLYKITLKHWSYEYLLQRKYVNVRQTMFTEARRGVLYVETVFFVWISFREHFRGFLSVMDGCFQSHSTYSIIIYKTSCLKQNWMYKRQQNVARQRVGNTLAKTMKIWPVLNSLHETRREEN